jgi:DNA-binding XRE family transcriptional regulator
MGNEVREARLTAGLTQDALARLAGVQRKQVIALETGKNVTLATVERIVSKLPLLEHIDVGGIRLRLEARNDENRKDITQALDLLRGVLDRIGGPIRDRTGRPRASMVVSAARLAELEELIAAIAQGTEPTTPMPDRFSAQDTGADSAEPAGTDAGDSDDEG